eukprot:TRINITY_DN14635_c0_g1_i1.p1 TRINITY_DN14635_c0_g1~~TRINITY_DN14635_c0_g1_i1.p1  ORF type:complete len:168 (-),score=17.08 TRINITY_DN14635_c0_g1_i1:66-569(-)
MAHNDKQAFLSFVGGAGGSPIQRPSAIRPGQLSAEMKRPFQEDAGNMHLAPTMEEFLKSINLEHYSDTIVKNEITMDLLPHMGPDDIKELIPKIGPRTTFKRAIEGIRRAQFIEMYTRLHQQSNTLGAHPASLPPKMRHDVSHQLFGMGSPQRPTASTSTQPKSNFH